MTDRQWPAIGAHRLLGDGVATALVTNDAVIDWWCAPRADDPPLLWSLLDRQGARARWADVDMVATPGRPAGAVVHTIVRSGDARIHCRDALVDIGGRQCLARLARTTDGKTTTLRHELTLGGFDRPRATRKADLLDVGDLELALVTDATIEPVGETLVTTHEVDGTTWTGVAVVVGSGPRPSFSDIVRAVGHAEERSAAALAKAWLPRHHPERALDALAVLSACTSRATGAVVAAATSSGRSRSPHTTRSPGAIPRSR